MLELKPAGGGSRLVLMVDCWLEAAVHSMLEEEEHGSSTFVVMKPAVNENMAADRICNVVGRGRGNRMVDCLLWRRRTRTGVYVLRCLRRNRNDAGHAASKR